MPAIACTARNEAEVSIKIIAVAGGSGSGKTTLARKIQNELNNEMNFDACAILGQDSYYFDQSAKFDRDGGSVNFDHPSALDFNLLARHLKNLRAGQAIEVPIYDFTTHTRLKRTETLKSKPFIIMDGTLILSQNVLLPHFNESIFMGVDEATRFQRRLKRDVEERGRTPEGVRDQFYKQVKLMHDEFVEPSKGAAKILIRNEEIIIQKNDSSPLRTQLLKILENIFSTVRTF